MLNWKGPWKKIPVKTGRCISCLCVWQRNFKADDRVIFFCQADSAYESFFGSLQRRSFHLLPMQCVKASGIATTSAQVTAEAQIQSLARELPYAGAVTSTKWYWKENKMKKSVLAFRTYTNRWQAVACVCSPHLNNKKNKNI